MSRVPVIAISCEACSGNDRALQGDKRLTGYSEFEPLVTAAICGHRTRELAILLLMAILLFQGLFALLPIAFAF